MKSIRFFCSLLIVAALVIGVSGQEVNIFKVKGRYGFLVGEDKIVAHHFLDGGRKLIILGQLSIQIWDVQSGQLLVRVNHQIPQLKPRGFFSSVILMGLPSLFDTSHYVIDPKGKWIITNEQFGTESFKSAVVRNLYDLGVESVVRMPDGSSVETIYREPERGTVELWGVNLRKMTFATLDTTDFKLKDVFSIDMFNWHHRLRGGEKMIVGSGDSRVVWDWHMLKQGSSLSLRKTETQEIEKEFTAENLKPETAFLDAFVTTDEKYLVARRDGRLFGWEIAGDGKPAFEISKPTPKTKYDREAIHDNRFVVTFVDHELRINDITRRGERVLTVTPKSRKEDLDYSGIIDNRYAIVRVNAQVHLFDLTDGTLKLAIKAANDPKDRVEFLSASRDKKMVAVSDDDRVAIYDIVGDGRPRVTVPRDHPKERFTHVEFFPEQNVVGVARSRNPNNKAPRTDFFELSSGKLMYTAPFAIFKGARFDIEGGLIYQVRIGGVDVWNRATNKNFTVPLKTYDDEEHDSSGDVVSSVTRNEGLVFFDPELSFFVVRELGWTGVYELNSGKMIQRIAQGANLINPAYEGRPMINSFVSAFDFKDVFRPGDPLMLVANDGRVVTLWELK